LEIMHR